MILALTVAATGTGAVVSTAAPSLAISARESALRRVVALLDYVAGDYARAVGEQGKVLSADEHKEQVGFVAEAARELRAEGSGTALALAGKCDALLRRVQRVESPGLVSPDARALRDEVAQRFGVVLLPTAPPQLARGAELYRLACINCHGEGGKLPANLAELQLSTRPPELASAEETKALTPQRAFSASTYGVPNTAMPAFEQALDDRARWDLAFYLLSLSRPALDPARGKRLARTALLPTGYRELAVLSDEALEPRLSHAGLSAEDRALVLAALRAGPFDDDEGGSGPGGLGGARKGLAKAVETARGGDRPGARRAILSLYFDEFETHEPSLRARDSALVSELESTFLDLRAALDEGSTRDPLPVAAHLDELLARADALGTGGGALIAFVAALAIALREGVEAALLVAALLALLRKSGRSSEAKAVHLGWAAALLAGGVTWWLSGALLGISGLSRELLEGALQLVTAALLLYASHWLLASASARRLIGFLSARASRGGAAVVFGLAFAAIYREMFETVIFFRGLLLESGGAGHAVLGGALLGLACLAVLVVLFQKLGRRLKPRPLLLTCGVLLCGLAVVLVGNGAHSLQVTGVLPLTVWSGLQLPALGVYGTREGLLAQALVLGGLVLSALWSVWKKSKDGGEPNKPGNSAPAAA